MLKFKKLMSLFLAVLMLCGALAGLSVVTVFAEETSSGTTTPDNTEKDDAATRTAEYHTTLYASPEEKLAAMTKKTTSGNYVIYADQRSGEVAVQNVVTGQTLFTNPYDIGFSTANTNIKNELMSQIIVSFAEIGTENKKVYNSFEEAAVKDQIKVKNIKNGVRVEYTIGRQEARRLVPRSIEEGRFKQYILEPLEIEYGIAYEEAKRIITDKDFNNDQYKQAFAFHQQMSWYSYKSLDDAVSDQAKKDMLVMYPVLEDMNIYVLEPTTSTSSLERLEQVIKTACPDYSYEEMDYDHQQTEYTSEEENPPLFKMALEYTLDDTGFNVRLPANSIRFNESAFEVHSIQVLPFLGAGNTNYDGYAFLPDGSGALFTFEDMKVNSPNGESITTKLYGEDYAYHDLEMKYQQVTRYPVYGIVEETKYYDILQYDEETGDPIVTTINAVMYEQIKAALDAVETAKDLNAVNNLPEKLKTVAAMFETADITERLEKRGFAAFIEEGDALASLTYTHAGTLNEYDSISLICNPRPRDEYNLADAISVGDNTTVSVVSDRKYVGNYKLHVTLLTDEDNAAAAGLKDGEWYEASWLGMATAYRDRLVSKGYLSALTADTVSEDIPLYIESFGSLETIEKILSIPVEVKRPLTSADNVYTMYEELSAEGVANINFKLTGFANGGMYAKVPYGLKWEKAVSKEMTMQELFNAAAETNGALSVYPDFDFSYVSTTGLFDGFSMRKHVVRTIDDRYAQKREYVATQQRYAGYYQLAVSPAYFEHFYTKLMKKYLGYDNVSGISVGSLGTALNSDFDEDEPYNREDAKGFVSTALAFISNPDNDLEVMVDSGNAYTWKYVDHILGAAVDSSRYLTASYSVPFLGVVLHGYMNFAGSPLNMEGDLNYAKLKAIENGASVYFTLSYQNTQNLKEDSYLSKYYSVRYDIWFDDVVEIYNELNTEMKDLQTMPIIGHEFLSGVRVPDIDEMDRDLEAEFQEIMNFQNNQQAFLEQMKAESVSDARTHIYNMGATVQALIKSSSSYYASASGMGNAASQYLKTNGFVTQLQNYRAAYAAAEAAKAGNDPEKLTAAVQELERCQRNLSRAVSDLAKYSIQIQNALAEIDELMETAEEGLELILGMGDECPANIKAEVQTLYAEAVAYRDAMMGMDFDHLGSNIALQTFLEVQYMLAVDGITGTNNYNGNPIVGKLEKQFLAMTENDFGLVKDPATYVLLRYVDANAAMTDAQLDAKYGLTAGATSMTGLVKYIRELLEDDISFDPALTEEMVNAQICTYVRTKFLIKFNRENVYTNIGADDKAVLEQIILEYLHLNPYQHDSETLINNMNLFKVMAEVRKKLNTLTTTADSKLNQVADGNYRFEDVVTPEELEQYVSEIEQVLRSYDYTVYEQKVEEIDNNNSLSDKQKQAEKAKLFYCEYLTPETMREDIRNYIEMYYYARALGKVVPKAESTLPVVMTTTTTKDSLNALFAESVQTYVIAGESVEERLVEYEAAYQAALPAVRAQIAVMNALLTPYGDLTAVLEQDYRALFVTYVRETEKKEDLLVGEPDAETVHGYFYNTDLARMDALLLAKVEEKKAELTVTLGADYSSFDYISAVLAVLAGADTQDIIDEAAENLGKYSTVNQKRTLRNDVTDYYTYLLLNCLQSSAMSDIDGYGKNLVKEVAKVVDSNRIAELLTLARRESNYSMDVFMSDEDMTALVDEVYAAMPASVLDGGLTVAEQRAQVEDIIKYHFYTAVIKNLNCEQLVSFNLYEIYAGTLEDSYQELKALAKHYALSYTAMAAGISADAVITEEMFERYFDVTDSGDEGDGDEEASRYVSDDGRIVSVTYGQKTGGGYAPYKTFILNYNNFAVQVAYEVAPGQTVVYTISAYGYVTVPHGN